MFDITMKEHFQAEDAVLDKLSGKYYNIKIPMKPEFSVKVTPVVGENVQQPI